MARSWLVLDIGNTHTVAGLAIPPAPGATLKPEFLARARFRTDHHATADEYRMVLGQLLAQKIGREPWKETERAIVSSVVPALETPVRDALAGIPCLMVNHQARRDFELDLPAPASLGADRLANVAGALARFAPPFLIVDAGTATTFCLVDARKHYIGGAITPGLEISWKALTSRAAKLFSVELHRPVTSVGDTTETQLQSGMVLGYEALIEGMVDRLTSDARGSGNFEKPLLLATGGCINWLKLSDRFRIETDLTLEGLLRYGQLGA